MLKSVTGRSEHAMLSEDEISKAIKLLIAQYFPCGNSNCTQGTIRQLCTPVVKKWVKLHFATIAAKVKNL
ncbi:hypothetical protein HYC85_024543 [Camellia sinensis]|uniref:Uncharacterized protein n=1 Tax=Camellia sinensis TaxID=4442 RepID=A0A7J7G907_CAMSI|nr:hypothetical protein HYC85_024543 [Camellia sinensis]